MPTTVPNHISGLRPLWQAAIELGTTEDAVHEALHAAGLQVLELSVSGKKARFVSAADLEHFVLSRARPSTFPAAARVSPELAVKLEVQRKKLADLELQVERLRAAQEAAQ